MAEDENPLEDVPLSALAERARDMLHEVTYWQQVLADCASLAAVVHSITEPLLTITMAAALIRSGPASMYTAAADEVLEATGKAMPQVLEAQRLVLGLIELANGRGLALDPKIVAISAVLGVDLDEDEAEQS